MYLRIGDKIIFRRGPSATKQSAIVDDFLVTVDGADRLGVMVYLRLADGVVLDVPIFLLKMWVEWAG